MLKIYLRLMGFNFYFEEDSVVADKEVIDFEEMCLEDRIERAKRVLGIGDLFDRIMIVNLNKILSKEADKLFFATSMAYLREALVREIITEIRFKVLDEESFVNIIRLIESTPESQKLGIDK